MKWIEEKEPYKGCIFWGPYTKKRKDNKGKIKGEVVFLFYKCPGNKKQRMISYPRYLVETFLGRKLAKNEKVVNLDGNKLNNDLSNIKIVKTKPKEEKRTFVCPNCGKKFTLSGMKLSQLLYRMRIRENFSGPFCSIECAREYNKKKSLEENYFLETREPYKGWYIAKKPARKSSSLEIAIVDPEGNKKRIPYHRYLMEIKLGRFLDKNEKVYHKDGNLFNNNLDNLIVKKVNEEKEFICPMCGKRFTLSGDKLSSRMWKIKNGKEKYGPFCSKKCASNFHRVIALLKKEISKELKIIPKDEILAQKFVKIKEQVQMENRRNFWIETRSPYKGCKVVGPSKIKSTNTYVVEIYRYDEKEQKWKRFKTTAYARFLMEVKLGRFLTKKERVFHKDRNLENNDYSNLILV